MSDDPPDGFPRAHFGDVDKPLPDWREAEFDDSDDDEDIPTPPDVIEMLGFDPADEPEDED
jgi:hypothetical protein